MKLCFQDNESNQASAGSSSFRQRSHTGPGSAASPIMLRKRKLVSQPLNLNCLNLSTSQVPLCPPVQERYQAHCGRNQLKYHRQGQSFPIMIILMLIVQEYERITESETSSVTKTEEQSSGAAREGKQCQHFQTRF